MSNGSEAGQIGALLCAVMAIFKTHPNPEKLGENFDAMSALYESRAPDLWFDAGVSQEEAIEAASEFRRWKDVISKRGLERNP